MAEDLDIARHLSRMPESLSGGETAGGSGTDAGHPAQSAAAGRTIVGSGRSFERPIHLVVEKSIANGHYHPARNARQGRGGSTGQSFCCFCSRSRYHCPIARKIFCPPSGSLRKSANFSANFGFSALCGMVKL